MHTTPPIFIPELPEAASESFPMKLLSYLNPTFMFKPTSAHGNADALSHLPLPVQFAQTPEPMETVLLMEQLASSPVTAQHIRAWTERDPLLSHVLQFVQNGWREIVDEDLLKPFWRKKSRTARKVAFIGEIELSYLNLVEQRYCMSYMVVILGKLV